MIENARLLVEIARVITLWSWTAIIAVSAFTLGFVVTLAYLPFALLLSLAAVMLGHRPVASHGRAGNRARDSYAIAYLACVIAGRRRSQYRDEWPVILDHIPDQHERRQAWRRLGCAFGFLVAALHFRARDVSKPGWRAVDWTLRKDCRRDAAITALTGLLAVYLTAREGVYAFVTVNWQPCAGLGGGLFVFTHWLRRVRGVEVEESGTPLQDTDIAEGTGSGRLVSGAQSDFRSIGAPVSGGGSLPFDGDGDVNAQGAGENRGGQLGGELEQGS